MTASDSYQQDNLQIKRGLPQKVKKSALFNPKMPGVFHVPSFASYNQTPCYDQPLLAALI